ncbi:MAG: hypothetical protein ABSH22_05750 [Tepidisphaeraceae bacterium]|jgi:hypothetical protein
MISEEAIVKAMEQQRIQLPPLTVRLVERQPRLRMLAGEAYQPDALVEVAWRRRRWKFLGEIKAYAAALAFENAVGAAQAAAQKARLHPMIVLPYLSPENLARLEARGVSGLDLCGNGIVTVSGEVLVLRTGQPNRFPRSEPIRNVYRGDSSLVGRAFLARPRYDAVGEIVEFIKARSGRISFSTVSKVVKTLEADLIVDRSEGQIRLLQADKLLEQLGTNYCPPKISERSVGKVDIAEGELPKTLAEAARRIGARFVLTGAASAPRYSVAAREPVVAAYCSVSPQHVLSSLGARFEETDRFPNIDLLYTEDNPPYFESTGQDGIRYASPVQAYLELASGDKRQKETADQVRDYILRRIREYRESA